MLTFMAFCGSMAAVKATGFDGWYATEIFCKRCFEQDQLETAVALREVFEDLLK